MCKTGSGAGKCSGAKSNTVRRQYHSDGPYQPPPIPEVEDSEWFFEVDHISDTRDVPRRLYFVHCLGGGQGWHDAILLSGCGQHV